MCDSLILLESALEMQVDILYFHVSGLVCHFVCAYVLPHAKNAYY
jgi:hypothetical protein